MSKKKKVLKKSPVAPKEIDITATGEQQKTWSYAKQDADTNTLCKLNFTLRTDVDSQMKIYVELLERGLADLKKDLEMFYKMQNQK